MNLTLTARAAAAGTALLAALPGATSPTLADPGRTAPPGCAHVIVAPGDTTWRIARDHGLTLDQIAALNPHIDNLARIHPGDQLATSCTPTPAAVDVARFFDEREPDGRLTWRSIVAHLYHQDMRGDDLITLAAIAECESNRWPTAVGDNHLTNAVWGPSIGFLQVRTLRAQRATNGPRDEDALRSSVAHQAWAATEVWRAQGFNAWTCYRNGHHKGLLAAVRTAAVEIGVA